MWLISENNWQYQHSIHKERRHKIGKFVSTTEDGNQHFANMLKSTGRQGLGQRSWYSDSLWAGWSRDRIPVGARFSAPGQTGAGAHPTSCTMGTGSFLGVKQPGCGADHPHPSKSQGHKRYLISPSGLLQGELYLYLCPYMYVACFGLYLGHPQESCAGKHCSTTTTALNCILAHNLQQISKKRNL